MNFYEIVEQLQLKAIGTALDPNLESFWREKCREYSAAFHTPLHVVMELDPEFVLLNLYETYYSRDIVSENLEEILERLYKMRDPDYEPMEQEELEDLVDAVLSKEMKRKGEVRLDKKKAEPEKPKETVSLPGEQPKSGGLKFDDLHKMEENSEFGKSGFRNET